MDPYTASLMADVAQNTLLAGAAGLTAVGGIAYAAGRRIANVLDDRFDYLCCLAVWEKAPLSAENLQTQLAEPATATDIPDMIMDELHPPRFMLPPDGAEPLMINVHRSHATELRSILEAEMDLVGWAHASMEGHTPADDIAADGLILCADLLRSIRHSQAMQRG